MPLVQSLSVLKHGAISTNELPLSTAQKATAFLRASIASQLQAILAAYAAGTLTNANGGALKDDKSIRTVNDLVNAVLQMPPAKIQQIFGNIAAERSISSGGHTWTSKANFQDLATQESQLEVALYEATDLNLYTGNLDLNKIPKLIANLQEYQAYEQSTLPAGVGGGITNVNNMWFINGARSTTGEIAMKILFKNYFEQDAQINAGMASMIAQTENARLASALAEALTVHINGMSVTDTLNSAKLLDLANSVVANANSGAMTGQQLLNKALLNIGVSTYKAAEAKTLVTRIQQFANTSLSDNQILQQNIAQANHIRTAILQALSNLAKSWAEFLGSMKPTP